MKNSGIPYLCLLFQLQITLADSFYLNHNAVCVGFLSRSFGPCFAMGICLIWLNHGSLIWSISSVTAEMDLFQLAYLSLFALAECCSTADNKILDVIYKYHNLTLFNNLILWVLTFDFWRYISIERSRNHEGSEPAVQRKMNADSKIKLCYY